VYTKHVSDDRHIVNQTVVNKKTSLMDRPPHLPSVKINKIRDQRPLNNLIYKDERLFVCLYLIQIHISEQIATKLCTHLPLRLEETVGYVWFENVWNFSTFLTFFVGSECTILGTTWLPAHDSSATALYQWFLQVWVWRQGNDVVAGDTCAFLL
jgi:hypothetical protein